MTWFSSWRKLFECADDRLARWTVFPERVAVKVTFVMIVVVRLQWWKWKWMWKWKLFKGLYDGLACWTVFPEGLDVKVTFIAMIMMIEIRCKLSRLMLVTMAICKKLRNRLTSNKATACIGNHCLVHRVEMVHLKASGYTWDAFMSDSKHATWKYSWQLGFLAPFELTIMTHFVDRVNFFRSM